MADIIFLHHLKLDVKIGTYQWEQRILQPIIFDIELFTNTRLAAQSHLLTDTLDYADLAICLQDFVSTKAFLLLETLAEESASFILNQYRPDGIRLKLSKPGAIPFAKEVGIIIERP